MKGFIRWPRTTTLAEMGHQSGNRRLIECPAWLL